jgi:peptidyl-prolyl cis-trans isomerase D
MIGTIRKHSALLWWTIIPITIISFVIFMGSGPMRGRGERSSGDFGSINGKKVTQQQYVDALNEFKLYYFFNYGNGTWPDKKNNISQKDIERSIYQRLLLTQKASDLGIHVGLDTAAEMANQLLRRFGRNGQIVPMDEFAKQVLQPEGLAVTDFENFVRHDIAIQQLVQSIGSSGALVTPQEAAGIYQREHQELASQIVFFSAKNYVSSVTVTPEAVANFYTNYLAEYRLPDRVQVNYVAFDVSNFLAQSKAEWAKTNFDAQIDAVYLQYGAQAFPDAKTPADAKVKIRELMIRQRALTSARAQANEFASTVFNLEPARADNLATVAKQKGLSVQTTAPFAAETGPQEFAAPEGFTKTAFGLTPDEPFANPIVSTNAIYVIALARQLPSEIPSLADIRARVTQDFQMQQATVLAREAGTNDYIKITISMAAGKSFAAACTADGLPPQTLPPFSMSTRELPELGERADLNQLKQAAFTTAVGHVSNFQETDTGGFVLFVQSQLPVDQAVMNAELPQFTETLRRSRENEAFNEWFNQVFNEWFEREAGQELRKRMLGTTE